MYSETKSSVVGREANRGTGEGERGREGEREGRRERKMEGGIISVCG